MKLPRFDAASFDRFLRYLGLAVLAAALIVTLLPREKRPGEHPTLIFTQWWAAEMEDGSLRALADEFEESRQGVSIILDTRPYDEIRDKLVYAGEEGGSPDILGLDPRWLSDLVRNGFLELPDDYRAESARDFAPIIANMDVLFYRIDLIQSAGFDRPPKNRDEFLQIARATANAARNHYGLSLALSPKNPWDIYSEFLPWFWAAGAPLLRDGQARFDAPQGDDTLTFLAELRREGLIAPGAFTKTAGEKVEEFISGRAAMMIGSVSDIPAIRERGVSFGITAVPGPASYIGKPVFGLRGWYGGINRAGKYKNEARAFLNFLVENRSRIGAAAKAVPGGRTAEDSITGDPLYSKVYDIYEAGEALEEFTGIPGGRIETLFRQELYRMFEEEQSPAATAEAIRRSLGEIW